MFDILFDLFCLRISNHVFDIRIAEISWGSWTPDKDAHLFYLRIANGNPGWRLFDLEILYSSLWLKPLLKRGSC